MNKNNTIIISGIIAAFLIGTLSANPVVDAASPVVGLLTDGTFGLEAIKNAIDAIESSGIPANTQTQIDNIETETGKIQMLKDDVANLETELDAAQDRLADVENEISTLSPKGSRADLSVVKTFALISFTTIVAFDIEITNNGPDEAKNVTFIDTATVTSPGHTLSFGGVTQAICTVPGDDVTIESTCSVGDIASGETKTVRYFVNVSASSGTHFIDNSVVVFSDTADPVPSNNESSASS